MYYIVIGLLMFAAVICLIYIIVGIYDVRSES
jgi:hypothetical protein